MSILIKDMAMPNTCDECPMRQMNLAHCQLTGKSTSHYDNRHEIHGRPNYCPLEEVGEVVPLERYAETSDEYMRVYNELRAYKEAEAKLP